MLTKTKSQKTVSGIIVPSNSFKVKPVSGLPEQAGRRKGMWEAVERHGRSSEKWIILVAIP